MCESPGAMEHNPVHSCTCLSWYQLQGYLEHMMYSMMPFDLPLNNGDHLFYHPSLLVWELAGVYLFNA